MASYEIRLREIRLATDGTDDVALFDVVREGADAAWIVPAFLSPLFRLLHMSADVSTDKRQDIVAGLGVRAIVDKLNQGVEPPLEEALIFGVDYPGAPGDPKLIPDYERVSIDVERSSSKWD